MIHGFFLEPWYLLKVPALALVLGLLLIDAFISSTNKKIAADKAKKAAAEAAKKKQWVACELDHSICKILIVQQMRDTVLEMCKVLWSSLFHFFKKTEKLGKK
mgnify:FL=1